MLATAPSRHAGTYNNGQPYRPARGRFAPREAVEDQLPASHAVIDLPREQPSAKRFLQVMIRELKIRCYQPKTIKAYRNRIRNLLRWFGGPPHLITREDVRCYLELLVDGGAGSSWLSTTLSAIRTLFDKFCGQSITLGLVTPRRGKKLPVVLSRFIQQLLGHVKLETTTIYTKVAVPRQPKASPLDALFANGATSSPQVRQSVDRLSSTATTSRGRSRQQSTVGRMKIHMRPDPNAAAGENIAQVTIEILSDSRPVYLTGIRVGEPRRGWLNLQIPPLESWSDALLWLTPAQRERIESAEFYDLLQQQIQVRYRMLFPGTG